MDFQGEIHRWRTTTLAKSLSVGFLSALIPQPLLPNGEYAWDRDLRPARYCLHYLSKPLIPEVDWGHDGS
jgi:hypothetical protein